MTGPADQIAALRAEIGEVGLARLEARANLLLEFEMLRGPSDAEIPELRKNGYKPDLVQRVIEARTERERELACQLEAEPIWKHRLGDIVAGRTLYWELGDLLEEVLPSVDLPFDEFFAHGKPWLTAFLDDMPTMAVIMALAEANHRLTSRPWRRNDIHDMDALCIAVPYCDVVVTDKAAHAQLHHAKLGQRFNTRILRRLEETSDVIEVMKACELVIQETAEAALQILRSGPPASAGEWPN